MSGKIFFDVPCYALADDVLDDPIEHAGSLVAMDFGNMGQCVLFFQDRATAERAGRRFGHEYVIEVGNGASLLLILDAQKGYGRKYVAVDFLTTSDGQNAVHFHSVDEMFSLVRSSEGLG